MQFARNSMVALFVLLAVAQICATASAGQPSLASPARIYEFETRLDELRAIYHVPGMTGAISVDDRIVWNRGFGAADVAADAPADIDTAYHLASLTKPFAAVVLLQLVQEGKLDLNAPIADFGIALPSQSVIQVKHLLTHTSEGVPGEKFSYNGNRFGKLDAVLQKVTGRSFAAELSERILEPLELVDTAPNPSHLESCMDAKRDAATFARRLAQGYEPDGATPVDYPKQFLTAAGLVSTASDVARFSIALDGNKLLSAQSRELMFTPARSATGDKQLPYALGWFVQRGRDAKLEWHYGWWVGSSALIIRIPDRSMTFVLLANSDGLSRQFNLGLDNNVARSPFARAFLTLAVNKK